MIAFFILLLSLFEKKTFAADPIIVTLGNPHPVVVSCGHYLQVNWSYDNKTVPRVCPLFDVSRPTLGGVPFALLLYQQDANQMLMALDVVGHIDCDANVSFFSLWLQRLIWPFYSIISSRFCKCRTFCQGFSITIM